MKSIVIKIASTLFGLCVVSVLFVTYISYDRDAMYGFLQTPLVGSAETKEGIVLKMFPNWVRNQHLENGRAFFSRTHDLYRYDARKGAESFRQSLFINVTKEGLYNFTRAAIVLPENHFQQSAVAAAHYYQKIFPSDSQIYYLLGLAQAYTKNYEAAERSFEEYINYDPGSWQAYLDLSWVHFMQGEFEQSEEVLQEGLALDPENPWLNTSYGVTLHNLNRSDEAIAYLQQAVDSGSQLETSYWQSQYLGNDPSQAGQKLVDFQKTLQFNLDQVTNPENINKELKQVAINLLAADPSPKGIAFGAHMSACGSVCPDYAEQWRAHNGLNTRVENDADTSSCFNVLNAAGLGDLLAPAKTSSEWNSFYNNAPSGVSFGAHTNCVWNYNHYCGTYKCNCTGSGKDLTCDTCNAYTSCYGSCP